MQSKRVIVADAGNEARRQLIHAINNVQSLTVVAETGDGAELLSLGAHCDIVVMDLILGTMDGLEVLDRLRALPVKPVILVVSSFAVEWVAKLCVERGADYLMLKPCKAESVVRRILQLTQPSSLLQQSSVSSGLKASVSSMLHEIGIPSHIKGYQYLRDAIVLAVEDRAAIDRITKILYPQIARRYSTTVYGVERAIRHAIEIAWSRGDQDTLRRLFGCTASNGKGKPSNSEFIARLADRIQLRQDLTEVVNF